MFGVKVNPVLVLWYGSWRLGWIKRALITKKLQILYNKAHVRNTREKRRKAGLKGSTTPA